MSDTNSTSTVTRPEGIDWFCAICRSMGDSHIETLDEHVKRTHPDVWEGEQ